MHVLRLGYPAEAPEARPRKDLDDVPESAREQLEFIWIENVDEALAAALVPGDQESVSDAA